MAEKKKGRKRGNDYPGSKEATKPSSVEYDVAKWLRANVATKKTKFLNHHVEYFLGSKAVDALLTSKWATGNNAIFSDRSNISKFLDQMLLHKFYHRARKVPVTEQELKGKGKKKDSDKTEKEEPKKKDEANSDSQTDLATGKNTGKDGKGEHKDKDQQQKKKRKIRLDMHNDQVFVDGPEAYVWIYDPIPLHYWLIGALLVLGAIGVCMFPLWPPSVRKGVYYLSVAAAGFLVLIIALVVLRVVVFCIVWSLTFSRHHFWLLPNLIEDVGFFASFWPLYHYEYRGSDYKAISSEKAKKGKKKKDKCSDDEGEKETQSPIEEVNKSKKSLKDSESDRGEKGDSQSEEPSQPQQENTESESEGSQRSSTGKDFEMVDAQDVDTS